ncbi:MAG: ABC transporter permease [Opitutaceae bacterium]|nr:ABC transporter permease [Opitutaceae bacterium]
MSERSEENVPPAGVKVGKPAPTVVKAAAKAGYSQYWLLWRRFRKHRAGVGGGVVLAVVLGAVGLSEFLSPYAPARREFAYVHLPPQRVRFVSAEGFSWRPFVYGVRSERDEATGLKRYAEDRGVRHPIRFLVRGDRYSFYGLFESDVHLFGVEGGPCHLLGTDRFGRDLLTRLLYGGRVSLTVGLLAVLVSITLGTVIGMVSGFYGGRVDHLIQRLIELIFSFPSIPILMALSALLPPQWPSYLTFMGIVTVLSLVGWGSLAREIRGKTLVVREADYILAARSCGAKDRRILFRHILPAMYSHVIVISTLAVPGFILSESTLSFLGLGIKPPLTSWGLLLSDAMNLHVLYLYPWLLAPGACIIATVLALNFLGDGLRDAAAPFSGR